MMTTKMDNDSYTSLYYSFCICNDSGATCPWIFSEQLSLIIPPMALINRNFTGHNLIHSGRHKLFAASHGAVGFGSMLPYYIEM